MCKAATDDAEIKEGVKLHNQVFSEFKADITFKWAKMIGYKVWYIDSTYIKYWDDEIFGNKEVKEYKF